MAPRDFARVTSRGLQGRKGSGYGKGTFVEFTGLQVEGLVEFRRDLRTLGREYRKAWDKELRAVARPIATASRRRYRRHHPRVRGRVNRRSTTGIRAGFSRGRPTVVLNGDRYPWLLGQEWGTRRRANFPRRQRRGYFFWMTIVEGMGDASKRIFTLVDKANRRVFHDRRPV